MPQDEVEAMVERLTRTDWVDDGPELVNPDGPEAAALLTRLSAQLKDAREALEDIADHPGPNADDAAWHRVETARAALKGSAQEERGRAD